MTSRRWVVGVEQERGSDRAQPEAGTLHQAAVTGRTSRRLRTREGTINHPVPGRCVGHSPTFAMVLGKI